MSDKQYQCNTLVWNLQVHDELKLRSVRKNGRSKKRNYTKSEDEPQIKRTKEDIVLPEESNSESEVKINERQVKKLERLFRVSNPIQHFGTNP